MKKKKRIFASAPNEQAQQTKKEVLSGKCLRTQHDKADRQTKLFKAADGIIAALKKRSALPVHANNPRAAFTLAEVLIALTIIGVVSALTIPTLVQKTNKQEYVSALQKAYSTLSQATQAIIAEEGSPKGEDSEITWISSGESMYNLYKKHLNNIKECTAGMKCFERGIIKNLNGSNDANYDTNTTKYRLILADGTLVSFYQGNSSCTGGTLSQYGTTQKCAEIWVDVNGEKKPNQWGRDVFQFMITPKGLVPRCSENDLWCARNGTGHACACKVIKEGRMDY